MLKDFQKKLFSSEKKYLIFNNENITSTLVKNKTLRKNIKIWCKNELDEENKFFKIKQIWWLEKQRAIRYSKYCKEILNDGSNAVCVVGYKNNNFSECIIVLNNEKTKPKFMVKKFCQITYDDENITCFPEYKYLIEDDWILAPRAQK